MRIAVPRPSAASKEALLPAELCAMFVVPSASNSGANTVAVASSLPRERVSAKVVTEILDDQAQNWTDSRSIWQQLDENLKTANPKKELKTAKKLMKYEDKARQTAEQERYRRVTGELARDYMLEALCASRSPSDKAHLLVGNKRHIKEKSREKFMKARTKLIARQGDPVKALKYVKKAETAATKSFLSDCAKRNVLDCISGSLRVNDISVDPASNTVLAIPPPTNDSDDLEGIINFIMLTRELFPKSFEAAPASRI